MKKLNLDLDDLTNAALKRMVKQLLTASDSEEQSILDQLMEKAKGQPSGDKPAKRKPSEGKNDLADLVEEKRGKAPRIPVEECDDCGDDDSETEEDS